MTIWTTFQPQHLPCVAMFWFRRDGQLSTTAARCLVCSDTLHVDIVAFIACPSTKVLCSGSPFQADPGIDSEPCRNIAYLCSHFGVINPKVSHRKEQDPRVTVTFVHIGVCSLCVSSTCCISCRRQQLDYGGLSGNKCCICVALPDLGSGRGTICASWLKVVLLCWISSPVWCGRRHKAACPLVWYRSTSLARFSIPLRAFAC